MTKDVIITIRGLQFVQDEEDMEPVEVVTTGEYYKKNGWHYLLFEEAVEGYEDTTHNVIKFREDHLEVRKKGLIQVHMVFEENKKTISFYQTPFGVMNMGIATTNIQVQEEQKHLELLVNYALDLNDNYVADCNIYLRVNAKEDGNFCLES